jgi:GTP cyclohydrolase-4
LKRPDEYDMVRRAHLRPQFVEDVTRTTAEALASALAAQSIDPDGVHIDVAAESHESIHGHDIEAHIHLTLRDG